MLKPVDVMLLEESENGRGLTFVLGKGCFCPWLGSVRMPP